MKTRKDDNANQPHYPSRLHIEARAEVNGGYTCHYMAEFSAFLNSDGRYQTKAGEFVSVKPIPGKNTGRWCPAVYVSDAQINRELLYTTDTEYKGEAKVWTPIGNIDGTIKLTDLPKKKALNKPMNARTSLFFIKVKGTIIATDASENDTSDCNTPREHLMQKR